MDPHVLQPLSFSSLVPDPHVVAGAGIALLAALVFVNLGLLFPGLLTSLGGPQPSQGRESLEAGPRDAPVITEPTRPRPAETNSDLGRIERPYVWR